MPRLRKSKAASPLSLLRVAFIGAGSSIGHGVARQAIAQKPIPAACPFACDRLTARRCASSISFFCWHCFWSRMAGFREQFHTWKRRTRMRRQVRNMRMNTNRSSWSKFRQIPLRMHRKNWFRTLHRTRIVRLRFLIRPPSLPMDLRPQHFCARAKHLRLSAFQRLR